jgi:uncharacterized membrane protein
VTALLRFIGLLNAAVWCGSAIFLVFALPALFSPELKRLLTDAGVGFAAEAIIARFFIVQYWCGAIALLHLLAEYFYFGKQAWRLNLAVVTVVLILGLLGGWWVQPKMRSLHIAKYYGKTLEQRTRADKSFKAWHAASEGANLLVIGGLIWYLWRVSTQEETARFVSFSKMRG